MSPHHLLPLFFFFNDTATTEIYTLSLHDALPISLDESLLEFARRLPPPGGAVRELGPESLNWRYGQHPHTRFTFARLDRKSTRLSSSHLVISYAVFCLKKKKRTYI